MHLLLVTLVTLASVSSAGAMRPSFQFREQHNRTALSARRRANIPILLREQRSSNSHTMAEADGLVAILPAFADLLPPVARALVQYDGLGARTGEQGLPSTRPRAPPV